MQEIKNGIDRTHLKLKQILMFYKNYRADIADPKSELYKLKQEFEKRNRKN